MREAERVADGDHRLADHQVVAAPHGDGGKFFAGLDSQHRQVGVGIRAHDPGVVFAFVLQNRFDGPRSLDDMGVGQYQPSKNSSKNGLPKPENGLDRARAS